MILLQSQPLNVLYDNFMQDLLTNDTTDSLISGITIGMVAIAGALATSFIFISIAWNYISTIIKGGPNTFSLAEVSRIWMLWLLIGAFPIVMAIPSYFAEALRTGTAALVNQTDIDNYQQYINLRSNYEASLEQMDSTKANKYMLQSNTSTANGTTPVPNNNNNISPNGSAVDANAEPSLWNSVLNLFSYQQALATIITGIIFILSQILKLAILAFCVAGSKVLFCIGPLAVAFSVLPWWKDKLLDWFNFYCTLLFTPVIMNVIDAIAMHHLYENFQTYVITSSNPTSTLTQNLFASAALDLTILFLYFSALTITSKVVGSADAGRVFSEGVNKIIQGAQLAAGISTAAAIGGSSAAGNIAGAGKSAMDGR
jgi:hypothetical protein